MGSKHSKLAKLVALRVIAQSFFDNIADLVKAKTTWHPEFATELINEVDTVGNNLIGKKSKTALFEATDHLKKVMLPSIRDVSSLKIQIDVNFSTDPARRKVILDDLGYTSFYKKVTARNQVAVIGLLTTFKRNIVTLRAEILATGTPPELLDRIAGYAVVVSNANTVQEQLKTTTKAISAEAKAQLDALYKKIIGICRIVADYYKKDRVKKELFTFRKVISNLGFSAVPKTSEPPKK